MATLSHRITHPEARWELTTNASDDGPTIDLAVKYVDTLPPAQGHPQPADSPRDIHPTPNAFLLRIHEGDDGATEAQLLLDQVALEQLRDALTDALNWDGQ